MVGNFPSHGGDDRLHLLNHVIGLDRDLTAPNSRNGLASLTFWSLARGSKTRGICPRTRELGPPSQKCEDMAESCALCAVVASLRVQRLKTAIMRLAPILQHVPILPAFMGLSIDSPEARLSKSGARHVDPYLRSLLLSNPARICGEWLRPSPLDSEGGDRVQG